MHDALVKELNVDEQAEVKHLEQFPPDTAGGIMTSQVTALYEYITVDNAIQLLRRLNEELEQMFYVYVINRTGKLVGVLSMRDLILAKPDSQLRNIMIKNVRAVPATMNQDEVSKLMRNYGYLAVPVVDKDGNLLGLITLDDVIDLIQEEATEDFQRAFGAGAEERPARGCFEQARHGHRLGPLPGDPESSQGDEGRQPGQETPLIDAGEPRA